MVRNIPRSIRRSAVLALASGSLLVGFTTLPLATANDLDDQKTRIEGQIEKSEQALDQSSGRLLAASRAYEAAQVKLATARQQLARTRGELAGAVALDQQMQAALEAAVQRLAKARAELALGQAKIEEQQEMLGQIAVQNFQTGDPGLLGLSVVLNSQNPSDVTSQLNSLQNVLDKEAGTLDRLEASKVLLAVQEKDVAEAKEAVAQQRREAAANLDRKQALEAKAEQAEAQVSSLVRARAAARSAAAEARAADLAELREFEQERDRIAAILQRRAEEARQQEAREQAAEERSNQPSSGGESAGSGGSAGGSSSGLTYAVDSYVTSPYGMRMHPVYQRYTLHDGTDFGAACGTPVRAAASGTVVAAYYNSAYGNRVIMDNGTIGGTGLGTSYNHLSQFATSGGQYVERGEVIGYVGTTGYSTGCHLHFMVFENGATVDPQNWL